MEALALELHRIGCIRLDGPYTLKSGISSPFYVDLRQLVSYPAVLAEATRQLWKKLPSGAKVDAVCGVPYTALPMATLVSVDHSIPMIIRRKEQKQYGTKKLLEGALVEGQHCIVIEDVVSSGASVLETVAPLRSEQLCVEHALVMLNREQGGEKALQAQEVTLHSLFTITELVQILFNNKKIGQELLDSILHFVRSTPIVTEKTPVLPFEERKTRTSNGFARRVFDIMASKQSNLCVAADLTETRAILALADTIGPMICVLKTHVDIISDFTPAFVQELQSLASKHNFCIFEDRKFADIGNTVRLQHESGMFSIASWAHVTNAHPLPGPGIVAGLSKAQGLLLIAEMSSSGNLITDAYKKQSMALAQQHASQVSGFICQRATFAGTMDPQFVYMTPGVKLGSSSDSLGQNYRTPTDAIVRDQCDIVIVGRGIYESTDPAATAALYRKHAWEAYQTRMQQ